MRDPRQGQASGFLILTLALTLALTHRSQAYQGTLPAVKCIAVASLPDGNTQIASAGKDLAGG
jgi:hypothetical protein